jgi:hypothetical protein
MILGDGIVIGWLGHPSFSLPDGTDVFPRRMPVVRGWYTFGHFTGIAPFMLGLINHDQQSVLTTWG